jgi:PTH1 family peptidyl-tRNA hydrolase
MAVILVAGLGNPGSRYQWTRHNAGFMVLDRLSAIAGIPLTKKGFSGSCGEGHWHGNRIILLKPQTFMNLSGRSVAEAFRFHKLDLADLVVVHDDMDIPFGRIKMKKGGGSGGHNGLKSLAECLGTGDFLRLRVGIGRPPRGDAVDYVLSPFAGNEMNDLLSVLDGAVDMLETLVLEGLPKAMSLFNNRELLDLPT